MASQMAWRSGEPGLGVCGVWAESGVVAPRMTKARQRSDGRMHGLGFISVCQFVAYPVSPDPNIIGHFAVAVSPTTFSPIATPVLAAEPNEDDVMLLPSG